MCIESIFEQFWWTSYLTSNLTWISVNLIISINYLLWTSSIVQILDIWHFFDSLTSFWQLLKLKPPQPITRLFFLVKHQVFWLGKFECFGPLNGDIWNYNCKWVKFHTCFLGGLSLHLNHLIQSHMEISYWLFGTLPIGLLLSNLDSRQLMTSPRTLIGQFWHMSIFGDSRAVQVICQKKMPSENQFFLDEGATRLRQGLGGF